MSTTYVLITYVLWCVYRRRMYFPNWDVTMLKVVVRKYGRIFPKIFYPFD